MEEIKYLDIESIEITNHIERNPSTMVYDPIFMGRTLFMKIKGEPERRVITDNEEINKILNQIENIEDSAEEELWHN